MFTPMDWLMNGALPHLAEEMASRVPAVFEYEWRAMNLTDQVCAKYEAADKANRLRHNSGLI